MPYGIIGHSHRTCSPLVAYVQVLILGAFAGLTILLGMPLAIVQKVSMRKKGFLNAFATGILIFLIVDVLSHAWTTTADAATGAFAGTAPLWVAVVDLGAMLGGIGIGLLSLTWYGRRYMRGSGSPSARYAYKFRNWERNQRSASSRITTDTASRCVQTVNDDRYRNRCAQLQ